MDSAQTGVKSTPASKKDICLYEDTALIQAGRVQLKDKIVDRCDAHDLSLFVGPSKIATSFRTEGMYALVF